MTFLAQTDVPGLQVRMPSGDWLDVPFIPGSFAVNSGDMMKRWTNGRFKSTPHRALPPVGTASLCHSVLPRAAIRLGDRVPADMHRRRTIRRAGRRSPMRPGRNTGTTRTTIRRRRRTWWHKEADMRRRNLLAGGAALAAIGTTGLARPAIAQGASAKVLKFVPQANLANPDPIWTTATVAINHGYMVWDTLYGINDALVGQPQMCAGHEVSSRRADLDLHAARRAEVHRRRAGARHRLHDLDRALGGEESVRPAACRADRGDEAAGRQALPDPAEEALPPDDLCARFAELLHHAGAHGEDAGDRADQGVHRLRAVHLQAGRMGVRRRRRST